ncbi:hypothetical protein CLIB1444_03S03796 [[Candida] jaroonii]|uniref:Uncharacterized protein n=1 Tax=[Candida] jaroonii TaxID=467808 RepID=A0ACA9Y531_9ASCO|nr:hypothetical protein CLIB1444_03S03796 [[Candida] jaroonii]
MVPPNYHEFSLNDISLMYSYRPEDEVTVPVNVLIGLGVGLPVIQFIAFSLYRGNVSTTRKLWDIHAGLLSLTGAMSSQLMVTCILKNICGLPRPDLISRCQPDDQIAPIYELSNIAICNGNQQFIDEGFRSFPSGHSSTIFCGMVITSLNISGKLQVFDKRGISLKVLISIVPLMIACFIACTRISDNRHFLRDVIGGSIIGIYIGSWFYLQYFPSVLDLENGGRAYPPRRLGVSKYLREVGGFWKFKDETGSFNERNLNCEEVWRKLDNPVPLIEFLDLDTNIKIFNDLV